jgi:ABC-type phosphate transport system auxiliary subunit
MLARRNEQLEAELASAVTQDKYDELKSEAEQEIARLKAENEALQTKNETLQTKLAKKTAKETTEEVSE